MSYERMAQPALEYYPCRYGTSKSLFRGPSKDLSAPYTAILGGTECYGRFVEQPFSEILEHRTQQTCVNLGVVNAGIDVFAGDTAIQEIASLADATVVQVLPAHNMSNRFYHVHPRRNDRFVKPTVLMQTLFQDIDFSEFHFTRHMLVSLQAYSADKFRMVEQELQASWTARMRLLLSRIPGRKVLLWLPDDTPRPHENLGPEPLIVSQRMVDNLAPLVDQTVIYSPAKTRAEAGVGSMMAAETEVSIAEQMLPPECHAEIAEMLADCLKS